MYLYINSYNGLRLYQYNKDDFLFKFWFLAFFKIIGLQLYLNKEQLLIGFFFLFPCFMCIHAVWKLCLKIAIKSSLIVLILWFLIEIPLRGIGRNCAIIANKEAIKYWRNCAELRVIACNGIAFYTFMQQISEMDRNYRCRFLNNRGSLDFQHFSNFKVSCG